ncbi:MAG: stage III sporulation protein AE [Ruminococcus sp.]|jgi:stage III sporulation protein AE|nr:stage III sporulation protein AE [Ruminococcus sp.]
MKKFISLIFVIALLLLFPLVVFAEETPEEIAAEIGQDISELQEGVPDSANEILNESGISPSDTESMTSVTPTDIFSYIWSEIKAKASYPLKVFAAVIAVIMLSSLVEALEDSASDKKLTRIYGVICVLVAVTVISTPVSETIKTAATALGNGGVFMAGYIPVFAGITASSGQITGAASYSIIVVFASNIAVTVATNYMIPILSVCMALGIIEAINPNFSLTGITGAIQKVTQMVVSFAMVIFLGLLSTQTIIGASADTLGVRAAKFAASNFIPIVGSAVADAYTTVKASLGLLRGGVGFFGIAAIFVMIIPPLMEVGLMRLAFAAAEIASDVFGTSSIKILLSNTVKILSLVFSIMVCFSVMLIISTAVVMMVGLNTVS